MSGEKLIDCVTLNQICFSIIRQYNPIRTDFSGFNDILEIDPSYPIVEQLCELYDIQKTMNQHALAGY
jgi:hypothetical protein